jgi:hypothetical protein
VNPSSLEHKGTLVSSLDAACDDLVELLVEGMMVLPSGTEHEKARRSRTRRKKS